MAFITADDIPQEATLDGHFRDALVETARQFENQGKQVSIEISYPEVENQIFHFTILSGEGDETEQLAQGNFYTHRPVTVNQLNDVFNLGITKEDMIYNKMSGVGDVDEELCERCVRVVSIDEFLQVPLNVLVR